MIHVERFQGPEEKTVSDQNLPAFVIVDDNDQPVGTIEDNDAGQRGQLQPAQGAATSRFASGVAHSVGAPG